MEAGIAIAGRTNRSAGRHRLQRHHRLNFAGGKGVHVGEDEVAVAVPADGCGNDRRVWGGRWPAVRVLWDTYRGRVNG